MDRNIVTGLPLFHEGILLTHDQIWSAIDALAERQGLTASALARKAGLDPTTFNKSKRTTADGRLRWPSTESVAKCLAATETSIEDLVTLLVPNSEPPRRFLPLIDLAQAGTDGAFDENGAPSGNASDHIWLDSDIPAFTDEAAYVLDLSSDDLLPLYRTGERLIVSPASVPRAGDKIILRTLSGTLHVAELAHITDTSVTLKATHPGAADHVIDMDDILWMSRIVWASQ